MSYPRQCLKTFKCFFGFSSAAGMCAHLRRCSFPSSIHRHTFAIAHRELMDAFMHNFEWIYINHGFKWHIFIVLPL